MIATNMDITLAQTPFAAAAARAREHAARSGTPLLAGKAVHILRRAEAGVQGACVAEALTQVALAHGAKVGHFEIILPICLRSSSCMYHKLSGKLLNVSFSGSKLVLCWHRLNRQHALSPNQHLKGKHARPCMPNSSDP